LNQIEHFLTSHDIPSIISFLRSNNYTIDSDMTTMVSGFSLSPSSGGNSGSSQTICMFHFSN